MNFLRVDKQPVEIKKKKVKLMNPMHIFIYFIFCLSTITSCTSKDDLPRSISSENNLQAEYIYRVDHEYLFAPEPPLHQILEPYPWEKDLAGNYPKITKEFFRCKGSSLNPVRIAAKNSGVERYLDCGGFEKHSLPLDGEVEFVYPILIDLLNYLQVKTGKRVVVTSGHRCPEHNTYVDSASENLYSKHQIGAEASFYVQGMEWEPATIVRFLQEYFLEQSEYRGLKEFQEFQRYEGETNVVEPPWMNKEIFIKLYNKKEGRNFDNRHPYPYISVQVRYDRLKGERVAYAWDKAHRNYLRK